MTSLQVEIPRRSPRMPEVCLEIGVTFGKTYVNISCYTNIPPIPFIPGRGDLLLMDLKSLDTIY